MIWEVLVFVQFYFLIGAILIAKAGQQQDLNRRPSWRKYFVYLMVVNTVVVSISIHSWLFQFLALIIILGGLLEVWRALQLKGRGFKAVSLLSYFLIALGFLAFSRLDRGLLLWCYLMVFLFDGFSQICGQLFGRLKLAPAISPAKTVEGSVGSLLICLLSAHILAYLLPMAYWQSIGLAAAICLAALLGDLLASLLKRSCKLKDFGTLLPGHGGLLDRFDSFLLAGAVLWLIW